MQQSLLILDIQDELNKPAITAGQVRSKIEDALSILESAKAWGYMDRFVTFTLDTASANPRAIAMPEGLRNISFMRLVNSDGSYTHLSEIDPKDITQTITDVPEGYFKDGDQYIWFDNTPAENYSMEMSYKQFTEYDVADDFEPWLMKYCKPLVKYQTLLLFGPFIRDEETLSAWATIYKDVHEKALMLDEERQYSNTSSSMNYK